MISYKLRDMLLKDWALIKFILPTERQAKIIRFVKKRISVDSNDVAQYLFISLQNASRQLAGLYEKTYLKREEVCSKTGGIIYLYSINEDDS